MLTTLRRLICRHEFGPMENRDLTNSKYMKNWQHQRTCKKCGQIQYQFVASGSETYADPSDPKNESLWKSRPIKMEPIWVNRKS